MAMKPHFNYDKHLTTSITYEAPSPHNPYSTAERYTAGLRHSDLVGTSGIAECLLLQLSGKRPTADHARLLEGLMVSLSNLGPRHYAIRAAMIAGLSKTSSEHLLPTGLLVAGGDNDGCREAISSLNFLRDNVEDHPGLCAQRVCQQPLSPYSPAPGFGASYGEPDKVLARCALKLQALVPESTALAWANTFTHRLAVTHFGWLASGLCAAVCLELGIGARECGALFQLCIAPGILSHALEQTHHPITAGPLLSDDDYELQYD